MSLHILIMACSLLKESSAFDLINKNDNDKARENLRELLKINHKKLREKYNEAEQYFKTSITLNNAMAEAHYVLGLLYKKTKRHDEALNELKTALVLFEKKKTASIYEPFTFHRISVLYALADLYALQGDDKKAFALLQQAVQITLGIEGKPEHLHRSEELMMYE